MFWDFFFCLFKLLMNMIDILHVHIFNMCLKYEVPIQFYRSYFRYNEKYLIFYLNNTTKAVIIEMKENDL